MKKEYETNHYVFTFKEGSLAEKEIYLIAKRQEECFLEICKTLKVNYDEKIHYILTDSPEEIGKMFNGEPCNGLTVFKENAIYAVYNNEIKCIGPHEDTHMISLNAINCPNSDFIIEGLAMFVDKKWWGIDNDLWTKYYQLKNKIDLISYFSNDGFYNLDCTLTYPIAGSFTKFLISKYGIERYLELFRSKEKDLIKDMEHLFSTTMNQIIIDFNSYIDQICLNENVNIKISNELKSNDIT